MRWGSLALVGRCSYLSRVVQAYEEVGTTSRKGRKRTPLCKYPSLLHLTFHLEPSSTLAERRRRAFRSPPSRHLTPATPPPPALCDCDFPPRVLQLSRCRRRTRHGDERKWSGRRNERLWWWWLTAGIEDGRNISPDGIGPRKLRGCWSAGRIIYFEWGSGGDFDAGELKLEL